MSGDESIEKPSLTILLDKLRAGGTERQAIWLRDVLIARGWQVQLRLLIPSNAGDAGHLFRDALSGRGRDILFCMGRTANSLGVFTKWLTRSKRLVTTCRTNRSLPWAYRQSIEKSDLCITNSRWAASQVVEQAGASPERTICIENALLRPDLLELDVSEPSKQVAKEALGLSQDTFILTNISTFVPGKNKQELLHAFAQSGAFQSGAVLLLVGEGREKQTCVQLADTLGLAGQVRFLGQMEDVHSVLQASDLFVSTSLRDSLPNALVEAQSAALPVVAYDVAGVVETFDSRESGVAIAPSDVEAFTEAIDLMFHSKAMRLEFSMHARERAARIYSPDKIAGRYDSALRKIL